MDIVDVMQVLGCIGVLIASYILFYMQDKLPRICGHYSQPGNFFNFNFLFCVVSSFCS